MKYVFSSNNYRDILKEFIQSSEHGRGVLTKLAQALNCQGSHLTRVLKEEVNLTLDQAYDASQFLKLNEVETNFFMKLVELERCSSLQYRKKLQAELKKIKLDQENFSKRFMATEIGNIEKEMLYYSNWHWSAIHILLDIPQFRTPKTIAERLNLSEVQVRKVLDSLESFGLIERKGDQWVKKSFMTHLSKKSPMNSIQHSNWRSRAVLSSQDFNSENLHYTMIQTISIQDFEKVKQLLLNILDEYRKIADPSPSEELICFSFDLFKV